MITDRNILYETICGEASRDITSRLSQRVEFDGLAHVYTGVSDSGVSFTIRLDWGESIHSFKGVGSDTHKFAWKNEQLSMLSQDTTVSGDERAVIADTINEVMRERFKEHGSEIVAIEAARVLNRYKIGGVGANLGIPGIF